MRAYAQANREAVREHKKRYEIRHPERVKETAANYRAANKDKIKAHYRETNEEVRARNKAYYEANREAVQAQQAEYRKANKEIISIKRMAKRYNLSVESLRAMAESQGSRCLICKAPFTFATVNVDHCHSTGRIRGLLCGECNRGLSCFKDNPKLLRGAIRYLGRSC